MDGSKILLIFAVAAVLVFSYQEAEASGLSEIVIHDDGGGDCTGEVGTWNQDTLTCTLINDLEFFNIVINSDGITLDGAGHSLTGFGIERCGEGFIGIRSDTISGATIKNITVSEFDVGIDLFETSHYTVKDSNISNNCDAGIVLHGFEEGESGSFGNIVEDNIVNNNGDQ